MKVTGHGSGVSRGEARVPAGRASGAPGLSDSLAEALARRRSAVIDGWLGRIARGYSGSMARFLMEEKDPFRNPVGMAFKRSLPALFDQLVGEMDAAALQAALDDIVRIRAVQDFTASQAVAFVFDLREVVRAALREDAAAGMPDLDLEALDGRIDAMALAAFDLYLQSRERLFEVKVHEMKRRMFLLERMSPAWAESVGPAADSGGPPRRDQPEGRR